MGEDKFRWSATDLPFWDAPLPGTLAMTLPVGERVTELFNWRGDVYAETTCGRFKLTRGRFVLTNETATTTPAAKA